MSREQYKPEDMIAAIRKSGGVIAAAARMIGCERNTVYRYAREYPEVQAVIDEENEIHLDGAERTLIDYVEGVTSIEVNGETISAPLDPKTRLDALKFYLRTKGRERGYGDRHEITGAGGNPLTFKWADD